MAQLLKPAQNQPQGRISQLLPSVKCSNCNQPVPLSELGDHICPPAPPLPKPPLSPRSATSLLPTRLQSLVSGRSQNPPSSPGRVSTQDQPPQRRGTPQNSNHPPQRINTPGLSASAPYASSPLSPGRQHEPGRPNDGSRMSTARSGSTPPSLVRDSNTNGIFPPERPRTSSASRAVPPPAHPPSMMPSSLMPSSPLRGRTTSVTTTSSTYTTSTITARQSSHSRPSFEATRPRPEDLFLPSPSQAPGPPTTPSPHENEPDTKTGGEAGMAGVGRRGFAAAARAAMFASTVSPHGNHPPHEVGLGVSPGGMDGRRANAPKYLDINAAVNSSSQSATTPPLSPNSGYSSHSPSPLFHSPVSPGGPDPPPKSATIATSRTPSPHEPPKTPALSIRLPFFEKYKNNLPGDTPSLVSPPGAKSPVSPGSESDYGGLAYADSADYEESVSSPPVPPQKPLPSILKSPTSPKNGTGSGQVRFPSVTDRARKRQGSVSSSTPSSRPRAMSNASAGTSASGYSRSTAKSTGALDRAMETLFEDATSASSASASTHHQQQRREGLDRSVSQGHPGEKERERERKVAQRSNTVPGPGPVPPSPGPATPRRSHTSPTYGHTHTMKDDGGRAAVAREKRPRVKQCVRCEKKIEDGRWIQTDAGGVLCERCWKNMYLPKCRRCNLPIEKQAVSSSDGQLKGKYHRECFNCHTCHKPFPDKEFYVFDGKPLCAYHYHEANESLCAAASCGQPIEGPCAVSHAGDRYHPAHLLCEHPGGCKERLEEYWEVDGRMLCERHAHGTEVDDEDERWAEGRAMKRVTRFIDLGELGGTGLC